MKEPKNQLSIKEMCLIGKGREAEVYSLKSGWVVKLFYNKSQISVAVEERVQQQLLKLRLPVVQCNGVVEIEERAGIVMEHCSGTSMLKELTKKPWKLVSLARDLAKIHIHIHSKNMDGIPHVQDLLTKRIARMNDIDEKIKVKVLHQLGLLEEGDRICHGDFHPDNILLGKCSKVIDWSNVCCGNPLSDVARTSLILKHGDTPPGTPWIMQWIIRLGRNAFHAAYLHHYFRMNPKYSKKELRPWIFPMAMDRLSDGIQGERKALLEIINNYSAKELF